MEEFKQQLSTFITSLDVFFDGDEIELPEGKIRPDVALIKLNKWLGENKEIISTFPNPKRDPSQTHNSISSIAKQFPVVTSSPDLKKKLTLNIFLKLTTLTKIYQYQTTIRHFNLTTWQHLIKTGSNLKTTNFFGFYKLNLTTAKTFTTYLTKTYSK